MGEIIGGIISIAICVLVCVWVYAKCAKMIRGTKQ